MNVGGGGVAERGRSSIEGFADYAMSCDSWNILYLTFLCLVYQLVSNGY